VIIVELSFTSWIELSLVIVIGLALKDLCFTAYVFDGMGVKQTIQKR